MLYDIFMLLKMLHLNYFSFGWFVFQIYSNSKRFGSLCGRCFVMHYKSGFIYTIEKSKYINSGMHCLNPTRLRCYIYIKHMIYVYIHCIYVLIFVVLDYGLPNVKGWDATTMKVFMPISNNLIRIYSIVNKIEQ